MTQAQTMLEPCPFCGSRCVTLHSGGPGNYFVRCDDCFASSNDVHKDHAVALWNTRATTAAAQPLGYIHHADMAAVKDGSRGDYFDLMISRTSHPERGFDQPLYATAAAQPVAWRYRFVTSIQRDWSDWLIVHNERSIPDRPLSDIEIQPLFATPSPLPAPQLVATGWRVTCWDDARQAGRVLLVWKAIGSVGEHVELGKYSSAKQTWTNTYGHPFAGDPDGWAPLQPFIAPGEVAGGGEAVAWKEIAKKHDEFLKMHAADPKNERLGGWVGGLAIALQIAGRCATLSPGGGAVEALDPIKAERLKKLQDRANDLRNDFGNGGWQDGLTRSRLEEVEKEIAALSALPPAQADGVREALQMFVDWGLGRFDGTLPEQHDKAMKAGIAALAHTRPDRGGSNEA